MKRIAQEGIASLGCFGHQQGMQDPFFFGYGSLVNTATHSYPQAVPARLKGYTRIWRGTSLRKVAYLSVTPVQGIEIDGLIAAVPNADWAALDLRERAYNRESVRDIDHAHPSDIDVQVYQVSPEHINEAASHPILLSYLDTVVQGYLRVFGEAGAQSFFETTQGWSHRVLDDRAAPIYPRHQRLSDSERAFVDGALAQRGIEVSRDA